MICRLSSEEFSQQNVTFVDAASEKASVNNIHFDPTKTKATLQQSCATFQ